MTESGQALVGWRTMDAHQRLDAGRDDVTTQEAVVRAMLELCCPNASFGGW